MDRTGYRLERLNEGNAEKWEDFNNDSVEGSFFHRLRWKNLIEKTSGSVNQYFLLFKDDEVFGLFPFIEHGTGFFRGLVPLDDPQRIPAILRDSGDPRAMNAVIRDLQKVTIDGKKVSFVRFSVVHKEILDTITTHPLLPVYNEGDMVLDFSESPPEQIWNTLSSNKQKMIKRFDKDGFTITDVCSKNDLELFYRYYYENIRYVGGDPQPLSRFSTLLESMSDEIRCTILSNGSLVAGGTLEFLDVSRKIVYGTYNSLNRNLPNKYSPSYYLWWKSLNWAWENNFEKMSMGVQHLDENNPRTLVKSTLGARFEPLYSAMIPFTKSFALRYKLKRFINRRT
jgi:hypothetical protein